MKIITGFIPANEGDIIVEGLNILDNPMKVRQIIGYLPENNPLYLDMYVKEYLEFVGGIYKLKNIDKLVADIIHRTGLEVEQHKKIGALSKGYRQRVGLAQAIIHDPKVLIIAEPTTGLDPNQIIEIRKLIQDLGKEKTIMLSTHIMQEVEAICDKVIVINKGQIVANDETKNIQSQNADIQVILVEFSSNPTEKELQSISGVTKIKKVTGKNWVVEAVTQNDIRESIFNFAVKKNILVLSMQKKEKSIEEVFQELTKE
jgi:ABC-2 type transport system ATP-binding protein